MLRALGLGDALAAVPALRGLRRLLPARPLLLAASGPPAALLGTVASSTPSYPRPASHGDPPGAGLGPHVAVNLHGRGPLSHRLLQAGRPQELLAYASPEAGIDGPAWDPTEHEVRRWCRLVDAARRPGRKRPPPGAAAPPICACSCRRPGTFPQPAWRRGQVCRRAPGERPRLPGGGRPGAGRGWRASSSAPASRWCSPAVPTSAPSSAGVASAAGAAPDACTAGELSLPELSALVAGASLLVSGDTVSAHLATALGAPSVIVFGPVPPTRWGPLADPDRHTVIWHGAGLGEGDGNADRCDPVLLRVRVDEVLAAALARLDLVPLGTAGS